MPKATIQVTVRLEPEEYEAMRYAAQAADAKINTWVAEAIREKVAREKKRK